MPDITDPKPIITDEQIDAIYDELVRFGADERDRAVFRTASLNHENYLGGQFEWSERYIGVRVLIHLRHRAETTHDVSFFEHGHSHLAEVQFQEAEARLKALFA